MKENKPSKNKEVYWLVTIRKDIPSDDEHPFIKKLYGKFPNSGKWLIFESRDKIDGIWEIIKKATEDGKLGMYAKVSTLKSTPHSQKNTHVICVYTYNWEDKKDIMKVREDLRKLGIEKKIPYKTDLSTGKGIYSNKNKRVSTYYC